MPYLIAKDYHFQIQDKNLEQINIKDTLTRINVEFKAEEEARAILRPKFDVDVEFTNTTSWNKVLVYKAWDRVYLDAPGYSQSTSYTVGAYALNDGSVYRCIINTTGTFDLTKWLLIGLQYNIYYAKYPYAVFQYEGYYSIGDRVIWKDKIYIAKINTPVITHEIAIQYYNIDGIPLCNVAPDDILSGNTQWVFDSNYLVPSGTEITNITYWIQGDNRDQKILQSLIDIVLYHLHQLIPPRNIPELRVMRYKGLKDEVIFRESIAVYPITSAIGWLQACVRGEITPNLPLLQPKRSIIRYGGKPKLVNGY